MSDLPYLCLDNASYNDAVQVNKWKKTGTTDERALVSSRFAIATNLVHSSLLASISGVQAKHLFHERDASFRHVDFHVSAAEEPDSNAVDHYPRRSLGISDTFKNDEIVHNISVRSSLATAFATDKSDESRDATPGIEAKPRLNLNTGEVKADRTHIDETGSMVRIID